MSEGIAERESPGKQGRAAPCTLRRSGQKGAVFSGHQKRDIWELSLGFFFTFLTMGDGPCGLQ